MFVGLDVGVPVCPRSPGAPRLRASHRLLIHSYPKLCWLTFPAIVTILDRSVRDDTMKTWPRDANEVTCRCPDTSSDKPNVR